MTRRQLGAPKGAQQTAAKARDVLGDTTPDTAQDAPAAGQAAPDTAVSETPTPVSETPTPASYTSHTRLTQGSRRRRAEPAGMTRRTYYLPEDTAVALDAAVARIQAATGGRTSKHEALSAIIAAGTAHAAGIAASQRAALLAELTALPDGPSPGKAGAEDTQVPAVPAPGSAQVAER